MLLLTPNQILGINNVRVQRIVSALRSLVERFITSDSASAEYDVAPLDTAAVNRHIAYLDEVIRDYAGVVTADGYDRGLTIPAHTHLGAVVPPESLGESQSIEPTWNQPAGIIPDVPDVPSGIPSP